MTDWVEWYGGDCPVDGDTIVEIRYYGIATGTAKGPAGQFIWGYGSARRIAKYRIIEDKKEMKTFGELTRDEQIELVIACYVDKEKIQVLGTTGRWIIVDYPRFESHCKYRIKPKPASINWDHVHESFVKLCCLKPSRCWYLYDTTASMALLANYFASFKPGDESITVYRPGHGKEGK